MNRIWAGALLGAVAWTVSCGGDGPRADVATTPERSGPLEVRTTTFPVDWLVRRIGGEGVSVRLLLPEGKDAGRWHPSGTAVAELATVDLIVANGAGLEHWMSTASLPGDRVLYTAKGVDLIDLGFSTHSHGAGEHSHVERDPRVWMDPTLLLHQANAIHGALSDRDSDQAGMYDAALTVLTEELSTLDRDLSAVVASLQGRKVASGGPICNYLGQRYGLEVRAFTLDPSTPPDAGQVEALKIWAGAGDRPVLIWAATPAEAVIQAFGDGVAHVVIDPLDQPGPDGYDYMTQARGNLEALRALGTNGPEAVAP